MIIVLGLIVVCVAGAGWLIVHQEKFGAPPEGGRLARIQASPNYAGGAFQNTVPTPTLAEGQSTLKILWDDRFAKRERLRPQAPLPHVRTDLARLDRAKDVLLWLGHSSYFIQLAGQRILVDPVFSDYGAPFSFLNKAFPGTGIYTPADMPELDYLVISHDHWDHLDYKTATALRGKVKKVIVPLGVGAHFERWGYAPEAIVEADWHDAVRGGEGLTIHAVPARHYSGRSFTRNTTLWAGYVLETPRVRLLLSGDTGYGPHFKDMARRFGGFDLVALDGGQYNPRWPLIHMTPEEAVQAAEDLGARTMLLGHVGRFSIASHAWDEPFIRAAEAVGAKPFPLLTPRLGEPVALDRAELPTLAFGRWWEGRE